MFEKTGQINQHKRIKMLITDGKYMDKISKSRRMFTSIKTNEQMNRKKGKINSHKKYSRISDLPMVVKPVSFAHV